MLGNNLMFTGDGPMMEGTWYNPKNGDKFTVRNTFFEDNNFVVQTTDNRIIKYDQLQDYIQSKDSKNISSVNDSKPVQESKNDIPPEIAAMIDNGDSNNDYMIPDDNIYGSPAVTRPIEKPEPISNPNMLIIDKALSKTKMPEFDVKIKWPSDFPKQEIDLLSNIMDINMDEIIDYYCKHIDFDSLARIISNSLSSDIAKKLNVETKPMEKKPVVEKKTTTKKTTTKKTN